MGPYDDKKHAEKNSYLVVTRGVLERPSGGPAQDGVELLRQCLDAWAKLPDRDDYPPRLLVLLTTVGFQPFEELLRGIAEELGRCHLSVPLVGCSVAGVLTEERMLPDGAALVCLSSRFLNARLGIARDVLDHRDKALESFLDQLDLPGEDVNPNGNRFLLTFLPGHVATDQRTRFEATEICLAIRDATQGRLPMVGGVAGDNGEREKSWQFADEAVYTQSAVAALVESDMPFGIGMAHGLRGTGRYVFVNEVADNGYRLLSLAEPAGNRLVVKTPEQVIAESQRPKEKVLFGVASPEDEGEQVVVYPRVHGDGSASVTRRMKEHWPLEILSCRREHLHGTFPEMMRRALKRGNVDPFHLACVLGFPCVARSQYAREINVDVPKALEALQQSYRDIPIVAGFMFGEIGLNTLGRPAIGSWSISGLTLGDEITPRNLNRLGYRALARAERSVPADRGVTTSLATAESINDVLVAAITAISELGFPGSMISLVFHDRKSYVIVAQQAHSEDWRNVIPLTVRRAEDGDILDVVGKSGRAEFIPDSKSDPRNDQKARPVSHVISQYVLPLKDPNGILIGLLQVDLGDMSNLSRLPEPLETLLQAFASHIATALSRAIRIHELALSDLFDRAVAASLTKSTVAEAAQEFIDVVVGDKQLFRTDMVHIRLASPDGRRLELVAGSGAYYFDCVLVLIERKLLCRQSFRWMESTERRKSWNGDL